MEPPDALPSIQELIDQDRTRSWTLSELAEAAGVDLLETKIAVARLVAHGELIRQGGGHYRRAAKAA